MVHQRTALSMLLDELGLVRLEHPDFAPPVEEQGNCGDPQDQDESDDDDLLRPDDDLRLRRSGRV